MSGLYFHTRLAEPHCPAGITVSKRERLPDGDFRITEYRWGFVSLWFVDADQFTRSQRQAAYAGFMDAKIHGLPAAPQ